MSSLLDTKRAYDKFANLLDQEIRNRRGSPNELERYREALDRAFYLLGWGEFEYLVTDQAKGIIDENIGTKSIARHAWEFLKNRVKTTTVRERLDMVFHTNPTVANQLASDYTLRNEVAHNYKKMPKEARYISNWLQSLQDLIDRF